MRGVDKGELLSLRSQLKEAQTLEKELMRIKRMVESMEEKYMRKATKQEMENYLADTDRHVGLVQGWMRRAWNHLEIQLLTHDESKYSEEEAEIYAVVTPEFAKYDYGTPEHSAVGDKLGPAWEHHLSNNPHHPEYHENGVDGMDLLYVIEMLCDWKAASMRNPNQDFKKSLQLNMDKKKVTPQLQSIMLNTANRLGMFDEKIK